MGQWLSHLAGPRTIEGAKYRHCSQWRPTWLSRPGGGGRSPGTRGLGGGLREVGEGVPGPGGREKGVKEAGEGVPGPGGREEG